MGGSFYYLCFVFVMLSCLFIATLWSPAGKGLTSWLSCLMIYCVFVTCPCGVLCQVWYLIVSISDLCFLNYFVQKASLATMLNCQLYYYYPNKKTRVEQ